MTGTDGIPFNVVFGLKTAYICCGRDWDIRVLLCDIAGHYGTILTFFLKWPYFRSEVGSRRSEVGSRRSEVGTQRSEVGTQRSEVGGRRSEVGGRRSEVGGRKSEVGGWSWLTC